MSTIVTGPTPQRPADDFAPPTAETKQMTDALYNRDKAEPIPPADASGFYGLSLLTSALEHGAPELSAATGASQADHARMREEFVTIAKATSLPEPLLVRIADNHRNTLIANARPVEDEDADAAQLAKRTQEWSEESRTILAQTYGAKDAEQLLARSAAYVKKHPKLAKLLGERGLGSRPDIVTDLVAFVFSNGIR
jgi:hypothetical protein